MSQARTGYIVSPQAATSFAFGYLGLNCLNSFPPKPKESTDIKISNLIPTSRPTKQLWSQLCHGDMHNYQITGNVSSKLPPKKIQDRWTNVTHSKANILTSRCISNVSVLQGYHINWLFHNKFHKDDFSYLPSSHEIRCQIVFNTLL